MDIEIIKKGDGAIERRWFQKECYAGVFCHQRSVVGKNTQRNMIKGLFKRMGMINTGSQKKEGRKRLFHQFLGNCYRKKFRRKERKKDNLGKRKRKKMKRVDFGKVFILR